MCYGHDRGTVINVPASYFSQSMQTKRYLLNGQTYIIVDRVTTDRTVRPFSQFKQVFFGLFTFTITELGKTNSISRNLEAKLINTSLKIRLHEAIRFLVFYQWNLMSLFLLHFWSERRILHEHTAICDKKLFQKQISSWLDKHCLNRLHFIK